MKIPYRLPIMLMLAGVPSAMLAQSSIDAYKISQNSLHGTARFQAMAGAFTALGGDLSTLNQNPAGVGIYRSNEVGLSFDIDMQSATMNSMGSKLTQDHTAADFTNIGYIGSIALDNETMPYFSWGISYSRIASFNRRYKGYTPAMETSLSNYIASFTNQLGYSGNELFETDKYTPYFDSSCDWLSTLAYNSYLINGGTPGQFSGLFGANSTGAAEYEVRDKGYIDEYAIDFGGNIQNTLYWGIGIGITDLSYTRDTRYAESIDNAIIPNKDATGTATGTADWDLYNSQAISGTGFNFKFGLIFKPINELRIGAAIHTPTWYRLTQSYAANIRYELAGQDYAYATNSFSPSVGLDVNPDHPYNYTPVAEFDWRLRSPWRFSLGVAGVLLNRVIVSADYERVMYPSMSIKTPDGWGGFSTNDALNADVKDYFQSSNILRVGGEFRALPWLSLRAGYSYESSNVKSGAYDGEIGYDIATAGTDCSYAFNKDTQYITAGAGLRYKAFSFDITYVHRTQESKYQAFTNFESFVAPNAKLTNTDNKLVFSLAYRF